MKQKAVLEIGVAVPQHTKTLLPLFLVGVLLLTALLFVTSCQRDKAHSMKRAVEAWDSGDYTTAAEEYERYLQEYPTGETSLEARFQLANVYYLNLHRYEAARAQYREFLNQSPSNPNAPVARARLADVLAEMGRTFEAIAEYENLNPADEKERHRYRLRIADLYYDQQNYSQALTEYEKVTNTSEYDELVEQALQRQASILHRTRGQYREALPLYERLANESGDAKVKLRAVYSIADCKAELFDIDSAVQTLRSIDDPAEQFYVNKRIAELEARKKEAAQARSAMQQK